MRYEKLIESQRPIIEGARRMLALEELRKNRDIINSIDWEMTPEEAVTLYLEWGNNWSHGKNLIRSKNDISYYFIVNTWDEPAKIYFIRRNSEEAAELAVIEIPNEIRERFLKSVGHNKGVFALNDEMKAWLEKNLHEPSNKRPH